MPGDAVWAVIRAWSVHKRRADVVNYGDSTGAGADFHLQQNSSLKARGNAAQVK